MNQLKRHSVEYFKALSQALCFREPWVGAGLLLLILAFNREIFAFGAIASLIGYAASVRHSTPHLLKEGGLLPVNGLFYGVAMAALFERSTASFACLLLGALALSYLTKAFHEVLQHWKLSPLVAPYTLAIWTIVLAAQGAGLQYRIHVAAPALAIPGGLDALLRSMGGLLFLPNPLFGLLMLALISAFSPRRGLYFMLGTGVAILTSFFLSHGSNAWVHGYLSYSAGLVGLGLASFPEKFHWRTILFFCGLSAFLTLSLDRLFGRFELPILGVPYVLTMWLGILSRAPRLNVSWAKSKKTPAPVARLKTELEVGAL